MCACDVSIIMVNWHTPHLVLDTIRHLQSSPPEISYEIIVWDNSTGISSLPDLQEDFPGVKWIRSSENLGFGAGVNRALDQAIGACVMVMNPDVTLFEETLQKLYETLKKNPQIAVVAPLLVNKDLQPVPSIRPFPQWKTIFMENPVFHSFPFIRNRVQTWKTSMKSGTGIHIIEDQPMGAAFMIRRDVFKNIRGFDEEYFLFFEDVDLFYRLRKNGFTITVNADVMAIHAGGVSIGRARYSDTHFFRGYLRFLQKQKGIVASLSGRGLLIAGGLMLGFSGVFRRLKKNNDGSLSTAWHMIAAAFGSSGKQPVLFLF